MGAPMPCWSRLSVLAVPGFCGTANGFGPSRPTVAPGMGATFLHTLAHALFHACSTVLRSNCPQVWTHKTGTSYVRNFTYLMFI